MSTNKNIIETYKSRQIILEILEYRGYNIDNFKNFSLDEIGILYESDELDMLLENEDINKKVYIKYFVTKQLKSQNIYSIIEDIYHLENILNKNDDLIIIIKDEPNATLNELMKDIWLNENLYLSILNIKRLQFNILKHDLVPPHSILSEEEKNIFYKKFNIIDDSQLPEISFISPVSLVLGIRPGDIVKIERNSRTAIKSNFYRICKI